MTSYYSEARANTFLPPSAPRVRADPSRRPGCSHSSLPRSPLAIICLVSLFVVPACGHVLVGQQWALGPHAFASVKFAAAASRLKPRNEQASIFCSAVDEPGPVAEPTPAPTPAPTPVPEPPEALLLLLAGLQSSCFGVISQALPAALLAAGAASGGNEAVRTATILGQLASASAAGELLLSGTFGKLSDAYGRKPLLILSPAACVFARFVVTLNPTVPVLLGARFVTSLLVPMYWLSFQATIADCFGRNTTKLAVLGSRVQAAMGLGYSLSSIVGGLLTAVDVRLAYAASCALGASVMMLVATRLRETLGLSRRKPFHPHEALSSVQPLLFLSLFRRGWDMSRLSLVFLLQSTINGMGDLWQVIAREMRGWGAAQCGQFAALAGIATMGGTLLTAPGMRLLGPRGFTVASNGASAASAVMLAHAHTTPTAFAGVLPMALGSGKVQPVNARITSLAEEQNVPQGQLAAERSTLNAVVRVLSPTLYAWLFAFGGRRGVVAAPFYFSAVVLILAAALSLTIPSSGWKESATAPTGDAGVDKTEAEEVTGRTGKVGLA